MKFTVSEFVDGFEAAPVRDEDEFVGTVLVGLIQA